MMLSVVTTVAALLCVTSFEAYAQSDSGAGLVYKLPVTQDVSIERSNGNYNYLRFLLLATHLNYPLKRSLLQFQDLSWNCTHIKWAKMYVYFAYSHKPSFHSVKQSPYISRPLQVHQVKQQWSETQATSVYRLTGKEWNKPWLALDGSDADPNGLLCEPVTVYTSRPSGFMEFDITEAMRNWQNGDPNYGVLLRATNENDLGRDVRFYSNAEGDRSRHAYVNVLCD
jgi:hypothetical protein